MVFSSTVFLFLFLPIVVIIYYNPFIKGLAFKNGLLLLASLAFYAWGEPVFVFLMIFSIFVSWVIGLLIEKAQSKAKLVLTVGIVYHIIVLFTFKYLGFFAQQVGMLFFHKNINLGIELPIGISFFTFQMMSYLFDVYYKKADVQKNVFKLALYVSLFPQLIAGPIVRYNQVEEEINKRTISKVDFTEGMERFIYGLAKKVLLSNYLAFVADTVFGSAERSVAAAWFGVICYSLQIYYDFSGYSDMAIGLGRIFGFHFSENFNYPYISKSVTEFWRRWHISLGTWFRDYVYIPLGGNRVSAARGVFNIFMVWLLTGIWHGANWTYIVWGLFYFVMIFLEKTTKFEKKLGNVLSHVYTLLAIVLALVVFRADSIVAAGVYLGNMFGINSAGFADSLFSEMFKSGLGCVLATPVYKTVMNKVTQKNETLAGVLKSVICVVIFSLAVIETVASTYNPFIYFNF